MTGGVDDLDQVLTGRRAARRGRRTGLAARGQILPGLAELDGELGIDRAQLGGRKAADEQPAAQGENRRGRYRERDREAQPDRHGRYPGAVRSR